MHLPFLGGFYDVMLGAVGYAVTLTLLNWRRYGRGYVKQQLPRYALALPLGLIVSTALVVAYVVVGVAVFKALH